MTNARAVQKMQREYKQLKAKLAEAVKSEALLREAIALRSSPFEVGDQLECTADIRYGQPEGIYQVVSIAGEEYQERVFPRLVTRKLTRAGKLPKAGGQSIIISSLPWMSGAARPSGWRKVGDGK